MKTERVLLAEIYKQDGNINIDFPNELDVLNYELFGFLSCYLKAFEEDLINSLEKK